MVSVIIPVYNAEPYLRRCLDSVLNSTYREFELILVNDGSTDSSPAICEGYAARDSRVTLISQENRGASAARNRGLDVCRGEWVVFVDADDLISPDFLELVAREEYQDQDLLLFDFAKTAKSLDIPTPIPTLLFFDEKHMIQLLRGMLIPYQLTPDSNVNFLSPCGKAYRKSLIEQYSIRFLPEIHHGEDRLFNLEYALYAKNCTYIHIPVYFYEFHGDSLSHRFDPGIPTNHKILLEQIKRTLDAHQVLPSLEFEFYSYALDNLTYVLYWSLFHPNNPQTFREKRNLLRQIRKHPIYTYATKYNRSSGDLSRQIIVLFFQFRWYCAINLIFWLSRVYRNTIKSG